MLTSGAAELRGPNTMINTIIYLSPLLSSGLTTSSFVAFTAQDFINFILASPVKTF